VKTFSANPLINNGHTLQNNPNPRRRAKDVEATIESAVTWLYIASVKLMSRRLAAA
jgi:hypothetical protein